jgi:predicted MFS family arabinose efflux permease
VAARLYAYAFLGDFVLLYPVYALLFADTGLSTAEISSLLAIWSISGLVLEVPSGVLADATSRRALLVVAPLLTALGFALWVAVPSYAAFAAGFVLWGAQGALQSGALEALVYEELDRVGGASRYAQVIGRATAVGTAAGTIAIGLAAPVFAAGGYAAVGAASVLACIGCACVAATLPEHRRAPAGEDEAGGGPRSFASVLAAGVAELRASPSVRGAVLLVPAVTAIWGSLDEYVPLLAADTGVGTATVPLLFLLVYVGVSAGGLLGGRAGRLSPAGLAGVLAAAALALALGALSRTPSGFVLIAVAFGAFQAATVAVDARLQAAIEGPARSTVTSLASFATEVLVIGVFAAYAAGSTVADDATLFACCAAGYLLVAAAMLRGRARRSAARAATDAPRA